MPVIPVNPNHLAASAACKRTPSAAVRESPPRAAKSRANNALMHGASAPAPLIATDADNSFSLANVNAVPVVLFAAAAGSVAASARSYDSSSSESNLDIIGGGCTASGRKSTGMPESSDQFSAGGDDVDDDMDDDMPTDAEASIYSFHDCLEHYMERALISEDNRKAVELAIMVEAGTTMREMDPMKKEIKEKAFLNSYVSIIEEIPYERFEDIRTRPHNSLLDTRALRQGAGKRRHWRSNAQLPRLIVQSKS